ncbi:hypothetical protein T4B_1419 [Trichinella pseudospiralis]|uniref:Uncharacterized protein n=1 Tax=Trichinella pseudospiralis TaxID=6337 RepID=A0A0V1H2I9_TRIPS|nr:hypothetical protein T4B_1419 [Trichinella pseudospiralis]
MAIRGIDIHKWKLCNLMKSGFAMKKWARKDPAAFSDLVVEIHLGRHDTIRQVVSLAAKAFDPLRCVHKAGPGSLAYRDPLLAEIMRALAPVPRDQVVRSELHVFGDAAEAAYKAVAHLLTQTSDGVPQVRFVLAKACVTPIKRLSLLRLELMASLLAA